MDILFELLLKHFFPIFFICNQKYKKILKNFAETFYPKDAEENLNSIVFPKLSHIQYFLNKIKNTTIEN